MSREGVEELMDRWMNDPSFRADLRSDPEGTVRASRVELDPDELAALRAIDWNVSDEELQTRVNKDA